MKYYYDTEFLEGTQKKRFLGIPYGETKPTIDLISIGIVAEDDREYYAISKDFNLWEAWNRFDEKVNMNYKPTFGGGSDGHYNPKFIKEYWIRENVLKPIFLELSEKDGVFARGEEHYFTYKKLKHLIGKYGKTNREIAKEVRNFVMVEKLDSGGEILLGNFFPNDTPKPEFYAYYADYDWVAFCWLFGKMIDLPKGFPMYCIDLKQILDETADSLSSYELSKLAHGNEVKHNVFSTYDTGVLKCSKTDLLKHALNYPKQENEHNALDDAKWNKKLHEFIDKYL